MEFWRHGCGARRTSDQMEQVQSALTRVRILLNHQHVSDIVGQTKTTIDFSDVLANQRVALVRLSAKSSS